MLLELLAQARESLSSHKGRAYMTMFGIAWGVASTIVLMGVGQGFERGVRKTWDDLGRGLIVVWPGTVSRHGGAGATAGKAVKFTVADTAALRSVRYVANVTAELSAPNRSLIQAGTRETTGQVTGVFPVYSRMRNIRLGEGRFIDPLDISENRAVCVLGATIAQDLFPSESGVGHRVLLGKDELLVVGVSAEKAFLGPTYSGPDDSKIFISVDRAMRLLDTRYVTNLLIEPTTSENAGDAMDAAVTRLGKIHGFYASDSTALLTWNTASTALKTIRLFAVTRLVLLLVGAMTLAIGGVGVMNIMIISVTERTKEIGVRKAIGARSRDIRLQFFFESLIITTSAGGLGFIVGSAICLLGQTSTGPFAAYMPVLRPFSVIVALGALSAVALVAGVLPASRAANLSPLTALRYE